MLDWFKRGSGPSSGISELYRMRAEELRGQQAARDRRVRLCFPPGIGCMNLLHLNLAPDGTVEMPEAEAESFLRAGWVRVDCRRPGRNRKRRFEMITGEPVVTVRLVSPPRNRAST